MESVCKPTAPFAVTDGHAVSSELLNKTVKIDVPTGAQCYWLANAHSHTRFTLFLFSARNLEISVLPISNAASAISGFMLAASHLTLGNHLYIYRYSPNSKSLPFLTAYHFMCKRCNSNGDEEVFSRKQANFTVMCQTALANLMWRNSGRLYFSEARELIPFLEEYWEELTTQPRRTNNLWHPNIHKTLVICFSVFCNSKHACRRSGMHSRRLW